MNGWWLFYGVLDMLDTWGARYRHWWKYGFCITQVYPPWHVFGPFQLIPPHCPQRDATPGGFEVLGGEVKMGRREVTEVITEVAWVVVGVVAEDAVETGAVETGAVVGAGAEEASAEVAETDDAEVDAAAEEVEAAELLEPAAPTKYFFKIGIYASYAAPSVGSRLYM